MGITVAEKGIYKVTGAPNDGTQSFQISKNNNQVEVKVLGKTYKKPIPGIETETAKKDVETVKTVSSKQPDQTISVNRSSYIGEIGNAIGSILQNGAEKGFKIISNFID